MAVTNTGRRLPVTVFLFYESWKGRFTTPGNVIVGKGPTGITASDLDQDGDIDLAVTNYRAPGAQYLY